MAGTVIGNPGGASQLGKANFGLHLCSAGITNGVIEIAGELREKFGGQLRITTGVLHRQPSLAAGASAADLRELGDVRYRIVCRQSSVAAQRTGQISAPTAQQLSGTDRQRDAGVIAGNRGTSGGRYRARRCHGYQIYSVGRSNSMWLTAMRADRG
ncbi:hypothetical protein ABQE84_11330 [Mycolicibacter sinensis]